jgi:hypothetical protein
MTEKSSQEDGVSRREFMVAAGTAANGRGESETVGKAGEKRAIS